MDTTRRSPEETYISMREGFKALRTRSLTGDQRVLNLIKVIDSFCSGPMDGDDPVDRQRRFLRAVIGTVLQLTEGLGRTDLSARLREIEEACGYLINDEALPIFQTRMRPINIPETRQGGSVALAVALDVAHQFQLADRKLSEQSRWIIGQLKNKPATIRGVFSLKCDIDNQTAAAKLKNVRAKLRQAKADPKYMERTQMFRDSLRVVERALPSNPSNDEIQQKISGLIEKAEEWAGVNPDPV